MHSDERKHKEAYLGEKNIYIISLFPRSEDETSFLAEAVYLSICFTAFWERGKLK